MIDERHLHQCHKDGCDREAQWSVVLQFMSEGGGMFRRFFSCEASIIVCGLHTNAAMKFILSPENRSRVTDWMTEQGYPAPDFETAEFLFTRIDHDKITAAYEAKLLEERIADFEKMEKEETARIAKSTLDFARSVVDDKNADPENVRQAKIVLEDAGEKPA